MMGVEGQWWRTSGYHWTEGTGQRANEEGAGGHREKRGRSHLPSLWLVEKRQQPFTHETKETSGPTLALTFS